MKGSSFVRKGLVMVILLLFVGTSVTSRIHDSNDACISQESRMLSKIDDYDYNNSAVFTENQGQFPGEVIFQTRVPGATVYLCSDKVVSVFTQDIGSQDGDRSLYPYETMREPQAQQMFSLTAEFKDANPNTTIAGEERLPYCNNYFIGNDPTQWHDNVPNYQRVAYHDIYPGIDLIYHGDAIGLKYDFIIHPGADLSRIQVHYMGDHGVTITPRGELQVQTAYGAIYEDTPLMYQEIHDHTRVVNGGYCLRGPDVFGFEVESYNPEVPLVIDPAMVYSTFIGGTQIEYEFSIAADPSGYTYITGFTGSPNFPTTPGAYDTTYNGNYDAFVTKLSPSGNTIIYSTFIGGTYSDIGNDISVDAHGNAFITGFTGSPNFPTTPGAYDTTHNGDEDVFVTKLNQSGNTLIYSTLLGGTDYEEADNIKVDSNGSSFVTGWTSSIDFPTTPGAYDTTHNGDYDVFVTTITPSGDALIYSTYLGGTMRDWASNIVIDDHGSAYITGFTGSTNFPTTPGTYDTTHNGDDDVFVTKLSPSGDALVYSTLLGGIGRDHGNDISVDTHGYASLTGYTNTSDFPTTPDAYDTSLNGKYDVFVTRFTPSGDALAYSTLLGGTETDVGKGIFIDATGYMTVMGYTYSTDFPTTLDAYDATHNGRADVFMTTLSPVVNTLVYSTFLGGTSVDLGYSIAVDSKENVFLAGFTNSSDFPTTPGAFDTTYNGNYDGFVTKFHLNTAPYMPDPPSGPSRGLTNVEYTFCVNVTDPDNDSLYCKWDWGDGNTTDWLGPSSSNETVCASHAWSQKGTHEIRVKLKDNGGHEIPWSNPHVFNVNELKTAFLFGRFTNMTTDGNYRTIDAVNLRMLLFKPVHYFHYNTGEKITFLMNTSKALMTLQFIVGMVDAVF
jgi:hypothetical protein